MGRTGTIERILIIGFPHTGTTILKKIIGNSPAVYDHPYETNTVTDAMVAAARAEGKSRIVIKDINLPWAETYAIPPDFRRNVADCAFYLKSNAASRFIMVIKNPADVFGSLNRRFERPAGGITETGHSFAEWEAWAELFVHFSDHRPDNLFTVRYEDFVAPGHAVLADMFRFLGLEFGDRVLDNARPGYIVPDVTEVPAEEPPSRRHGEDHGRFRTWQINQPIRDMTGESAVHLDDATRQRIENSEIARKLGYDRL